ncbi:unnamed protein product, partial [marine sediment metagenome]
MKEMSSLENKGGSQSRRNKQGARSEAECQRQRGDLHEGYLSTQTVGHNGGEGASPPSFLVYNKDNVNAQLHMARGLITMWDYLVYKGRIGTIQVVLQCKTEPSTLKIMPVKCHSRYFDDGRLYMSRKIKRRLGKYNKVPGLMETLTYDPKKIGKREAWSSFG